MKDERAEKLNNKDRLLRIFSTNHVFENPTWLQFGEKKNVYLYLSQRATAAEEGWLTIASYVINLLIDFINGHFDSETQGRFQLECIDYDAGVVNLANPAIGSFAIHSDDKPGLFDNSIPGWSKFLLMVPTLAVQNHWDLTSSISWYYPGDKTKALYTIKHDFFITQWQLVAVQYHFEHEVISPFSNA